MAETLSVGNSRRDAKVIGLVASAHFFSHFYILVLPPIFPLLKEDLGVGYTSLGIAVAVLNLTTGLLQSPIGFLVDRFGAPRILIGGQILMGLSIAGIGLFPSYEALLFWMLVAGVGNAVYHPADYAILSGSVARRRTGRAFSIHTFGGYFGFAVAPVTVVTLTGWIGWPLAMVVLGSLGVVHALVLWLREDWLSPLTRASSCKPQPVAIRSDLALLTSKPILMALVFFTIIAAVQMGFLSFSVAILEIMQGSSLTEANLALSLYLWLSAFGVLAGGWIADATDRHDHVAAVCFLISAVTAVLLASLSMSSFLIGVIFALAGLASGAVSPSRDMLVRAITPEGSSGKVFGFVTTGFNIGGLIAPPIFGAMVDYGAPQHVFWTIAVLSIIAIVSAARTASYHRAEQH